MFCTIASRCLVLNIPLTSSIESHKFIGSTNPPSQHSQPGALLHAAYHATLAKLPPSVVRNCSLQPRRRSGLDQASRPKAVKHHPSIHLENEGYGRPNSFHDSIFKYLQIHRFEWLSHQKASALFTSAHGSRVRELVWPGTSSFWSELKGVFWGIPPELALKGPKVRSHATWRREIQCFYTMQAVLIVLTWFLDCLAKQQYAIKQQYSLARLASIHQYTIWRNMLWSSIFQPGVNEHMIGLQNILVCQVYLNPQSQVARNYCLAILYHSWLITHNYTYWYPTDTCTHTGCLSILHIIQYHTYTLESSWISEHAWTVKVEKP